MSAATTVPTRGRHLADLALPNIDEPNAARAKRLGARAWLATNGVPSEDEEDWRYTDLRPFLALALTPTPARIADDRALATLIGSTSLALGGPRLVFVNGALAASCSDLGPASNGVHLDVADDTALAPLAHDASFSDGFAALNEMLAPPSTELVIDPGTCLDTPIELCFLNVPATTAAELASPRIHISLGALSCSTVVEVHVGRGTASYVVNGRCTVVLGDGAQLTHCVLVDEPDGALRLMARDVRLGSSSEYRSHLVSCGSRLARDEVRVELAGEGATATLDACFLAGESHHQDHPIRVEHREPSAVSRQRVRGIVAGDGHGVFNGHVIVRPGASGTNASQHNANLICSDRAEIDTRPRLEIFADDVACAHGATVGRLDADALFYLRSRGIEEASARHLLAVAFLEELLDAIPVPALADRARAAVAARVEAWWTTAEAR